jgi:hypothetical protein
VVAVKHAAVEKVFIKMGVNKETSAAVDETEKHGAVDPPVIIGDPQIIKDLLKPVYMVVAHAVILREYDLNIIAPYFKLTAESEHNIGKTAYFGYRCAF